MPVQSASFVVNPDCIPTRLREAGASAEWVTFMSRLSPLDPWLVGGAARAFYFSLPTESEKGQAIRPKDWDIVLNQATPQQVQDCGHDLLESFGGIGRILSGGYMLKSINPKTQELLGEKPKLPGWTGVIMFDCIANIVNYEVKFDLWGQNIVEYLADVPTAFDGIAIRMKDLFILQTHEFSLGRNFLVSSRPVSVNAQKNLLYAHYLRQGL